MVHPTTAPRDGNGPGHDLLPWFPAAVALGRYVGNGPKLSEETEIFRVSFKVFPLTGSSKNQGI